MSGGSFDYAYRRMAQFADELRNKLQEQGKDTDGYGYHNPRWTTDVAYKLATVAALAYHVALLAKEAEWLYSSDTGEDTFTQRVRDIEVTRDRACAAEIDRLRADCEAFRKDAERYRWLRDKATTGRAVQLVQWMPGEMDAKFDDAMRATGAGV